DYNNLLLLVRTDVPTTARALSAKSKSWVQNAIGTSVTVSPDCAFVYRIKGQAWTIVHPHWQARSDFWNPPPISRTLNCKAIKYSVSDTSGTIGFELFESGRALETFDGADAGDSSDPAIHSHFTSESRPSNATRGKTPWDFAYEFFVAEGALEP